MKLHQIAKGTRAVKAIPFRPANAPLLAAGEESDEHTIQVGVRVLNPSEIKEVYEKALAASEKGGVAQWLDTHPLCRLHEMAHTVALACVDIDSAERAEPFFVSVDEVMNDDAIGGDNLAYLYQQHQLWQDECCGPRGATKTTQEIIAMVAEEAARPDNARDVPFSRLRPSVQLSCFHSTSVLLWSLLMHKSASSSGDEESSDEASKPSNPEPKPKPRKSSAKKKPKK